MPQSPESDGSSVIEDLSFEYVLDADGNYHRISKGSNKSNHSTPPTPPEPILGSPSESPPKISLSRSENLFPAVQPRQFVRVASGPAAAPRRVPRRTLEESQQHKEVKPRPYFEEKENYNRLSLDVPSIEEMYGESPMARRIPSKPSRILKGTGPPKFERISETDYKLEDTDVEDDGPQRVPMLSQSGNSRPRRSASLSDALENHHHYPERQDIPLRHHFQGRPGTSLGIRTEEQDYDHRSGPSYRQTPSPTNLTHGNSKPAHKRRDSDTLRSAPYQAGSPTVILDQHPPPPRLSPSAKGLAVSVKHRRSPTAPEPSTLSHSAAAIPMRTTWAPGERSSEDGHPPLPALPERDRGRERDRERDRERSRSAHHDEHAYQHQQQQQPPQQNVPQPSRLTAPPPPVAPAARSRPNPSTQEEKAPYRQMIVNKKPYVRLDLLGKGGSSRVYRVMDSVHDVYAIKRVSLDKTDPETLSGYMNEIALLKRLDGNSRIIRLIDSEVRPGPGGTKGNLLLVMECGDADLARLLNERADKGVDMVWIAYHWRQMLEAVQIIHNEKIVHSDLKPANFLLVKGQIKLIDFGIANAIANDTTNIQRDHQIGTVNYMSPEAIEVPDGTRRLKVGRASDVWSLGCILYQMVYGSPPFQHLTVYQKMKAIPDPDHTIDFPEYSAPSAASKGPREDLDHLKWRVRRDVISSMKSCLCRNPKERMTIPALLDQDWVRMKETEPPAPLPPPQLSAKDLLGPKETIIDPHYMVQLLMYGIRLGQNGTYRIDTEEGRAELIPEGERLVAELKALLQ